jgi:osomolarity two-component system sensor histidine kinase SLN1
MQTTVRQTASRLAIQSALQRYNNNGNDSASNWSRTKDDLDAVFTGDGDARLAVQVTFYAANSSDFGIYSQTKDGMQGVLLPYKTPDGADVHFGDAQYGYPPELYPKFTTYRDPVSKQMLARYEGRNITSTNHLLSGPFNVNSTLSLISITMPIINNTSSIDTLGWLTAVLDAGLISRVVNALEGLDDSGLTMIFGPNNVTNRFPEGARFDQDGRAANEESVRFVLPPTNRNVEPRHADHGSGLNPPPFDWTQFPAIREGFTESKDTTNNAGSRISTNNEEGNNVAVGYALVNNPMVDWMVLVEQSHGEVWAPITRLRNVLLACVFGTIGAMLVLAFPVAHYSSRPIRRLRDATKSSVSPQYLEDSSLGSQPDGLEDTQEEALARKEGFLGSLIHYRRNQKASRAERREAERRRQFRIPAKVKDRKHFIHDELTDLTATFNEMTDELMMQYERLEERVQQRTAELEQSKKAAEAANESKTLFIANISHELKTPLNGILGMCAVCMSEDDPIKLRRSLGIIYKSGDLLLNLLTDLLTFRYVGIYASECTIR